MNAKGFLWVQTGWLVAALALVALTPTAPAAFIAGALLGSWWIVLNALYAHALGSLSLSTWRLGALLLRGEHFDEPHEARRFVF